jgi:hypothetical protein
MPKKNEMKSDVERALHSAKYVQVGNDLYSNVQRVTVTNNEVVIDFFSITPDFEVIDRPKAVHLQRILLPIQVAKDLSRIIMETTTRVEGGESNASSESNAESTE